MADARGSALASSLTPERVARAEFGNSFRGFDPTEVRSFLARVAGELRALLDREAELVATVAELERRPASTPEKLDEHRLTELLGAETARVLDAAREAANQIKANAEQQASRVVAEAETTAGELRDQAESVLAERTAEAEAEAARILGEADTEAQRVLAEGQAEADRLIGEAREAAEKLEADARSSAETLETEARQESERLREEANAEAERVRSEASSEAKQLRTESEAAADLLRTESQAEAERLRTESEAQAELLRTESEAEAERVRSEAQAEADRVRSEARTESERLRSEAEAFHRHALEESTELLERSREDGRRMVAEARAVRERILTDMARRRNQARQQLEKLRAGRERLIDAVEVVRRAVEETSSELNGSLVEAKLAGERAARQVDVETIPSINELDAEVELAKDAGLIDRDLLEREAPSREGNTGPVDTSPTAADHEAVSVTVTEIFEADVEPVEAESEALAEFEALEESEAADELTGLPGSPFDIERAEELDETAAATETPRGESSSDQPTDGEALDTDTDTDADAGSSGGDVAPERRAGFSNKVEDLFSRWKDSDSPVGDSVPTPAVEDVAGSASGDAKVAKDDVAQSEVPNDDVAKDDLASDDVHSTNGTRPSGARGARRAKARENGRRAGKSAPTKKATAKSEDKSAEAVATSGLVAGPAEQTAKGRPGAKEVVAPTGDEPDSDEDLAVPRTADQVALHTRDAMLAGTARDLTRQLKLALSDEQNMILERVRASTLAGGLEAADLAEPYRKIARHELVPALEAGWRSVAERGAVPIPGAPDRQLLEAIVEDLVAALTTPLRDRLESVLRDVDDPAERVRNLYRETRNQRVTGLAEHATLAAYAQGQVAASTQGPQTLVVRWVFEECTPDCLDNSLAGEVPAGEAFPTGHFHPPAFVGCRCLLAVGGTAGEARDHISRPAV